MSKGERKIERYLKDNSIYYIPQKTFEGLLGIGNGLLSYDFYLPKYNSLIEYQGIQHEKSFDYFGGKQKLEKQKIHDEFKREYATNHNFNLFEIWYKDYDNIEQILQEKLNINNTKKSA